MVMAKSTGLAERDVIIERILEREEMFYRAMRPLCYEQWFSLDYTMPQLKAMLLLFTDGPCRMSVLSSRLGSLPTTTGIVERLVKQGLVVRDNQTGDRRIVMCKLSQKGQDSMEQLWQSRQTCARGFLSQVPLPKLRTVCEAMEILSEAAATAERCSTGQLCGSGSGQ